MLNVGIAAVVYGASQSAPADPSWFYSTAAESTATLVGFAGAFMLLRIQDYMARWRQEAEALLVLQKRFAAAPDSVASVAPGEHETVSNREAIWPEILGSLDRRTAAVFPRELRVVALLLAALFISGCAIPMMLLKSPANGEQLWIVAPVAGFIFAAGSYTLIRATQELQSWKTLSVNDDVRARYQTESGLHVADPIDKRPSRKKRHTQ